MVLGSVASVNEAPEHDVASSGFSQGNRVRLLCSGERYFPALLAAIEGSQQWIHLETYILGDDARGHAVLDALCKAARRGVHVRVMLDGFGSASFARRLAVSLPLERVHVRVYRPPHWWRPGRTMFRRLHRKLVVIDDVLAFVGGINIHDEPLREASTGEAIGPRLDFAVACEGPIVAAISLTVRRLWWAVGLVGIGEFSGPPPRLRRSPEPFQGGVSAALLLRDNLRNRRSIERAYLAAIRHARSRIVIASAYFLPGRRLRRALVKAARRGVSVRLLLQGRVEYRLQHHAQRALYGQMLGAGIEIREYHRSYLHAKVAVIDAEWATVGSSNIDPFSLLLAREANVLVRDREFTAQLCSAIEAAMADDAVIFDVGGYARRGWSVRVTDWIAFGLVRLATVFLAQGDRY